MLEHVSLRCSDVATSRKFYEKSLAPLGYRVNMDYADAVGFMEGGHTSFWVTKGDLGTPTHIAFLAKDRKAVDAFHRAALEAGGKDHGAPGLRDYSPTYYAAFVLDPDGHNIEAVTFVRGAAARKKAPAKKAPAKKASAKKAKRAAKRA